MRLFIASPIKLDDFRTIQGDFETIIDGKWVEEENLHLTWVFLGNVTDKKPIIEMMQGLSMSENEELIRGLGYFGRPPRVFYAKAETKALYEKAGEFKSAGFKLYRFKPHITLCRIKKINDYKSYKELIKNYREKVLGIVKPEIILYQSRLSEKGPEYKCIWKAGAKEK